LDRYYSPANETTEAQLKLVFSRLEGEEPKADSFDLAGRQFRVRGLGHDVLWFDFQELCDKPRAAMDYIEIVERCHTLLLSGVPAMSADDQDAAHRFTVLIDELYDRRLNLFLSAAVPPAELYLAGRRTFEFQRTVSRLIEMQSAAYAREAGHRNDIDMTPAGSSEA